MYFLELKCKIDSLLLVQEGWKLAANILYGFDCIVPFEHLTTINCNSTFPNV